MNGPDPRGSLRRRDAPVWQQAAEGIGLVIALSAVVTVVGGLLALAVSLLF